MSDSKAPTPAPEKTYYYRIKKFSGHLYQIMEIEVDETATPPTPVGKQDSKEMLVQPLFNYACPHPDFKRKK